MVANIIRDYKNQFLNTWTLGKKMNKKIES